MKNYKKHIDDFFREKLGKHTETPPPDVWEGLEGKLDTLKPFVPKAPFRWLWHFGMISLIAVFSVSLTRKLMNKQEDAPKAEVAAVAPEAIQPSTVQGAEDGAAAATDAASTATATPGQTLATTPGNTAAVAVADGATTEGVQPAGTTGSNATAANTSNNIAATSAAARVGKPGNNNIGKPLAGRHSNNRADIAAPVTAATGTTGAVRKTGSSAATPLMLAAAAKAGTMKAAPVPANNVIVGANSGAEIINDNATSVLQSEGAATAPAASKDAAKPAVKPEAPKPVVKAEKKEEKKVADAKPAFKRIDLGIKGGYERGTNDAAATKWVVAPYLQYHLSDKVSLMTQPAIKYAGITQRSVGKTQNYYRLNDAGRVTQNGAPVIDSIKVISSNVDTYFHTNYTISQSYDSIAKSRRYGGNYLEMELPILVSYNLSKQASVYGGVNLVYSKRLAVTEHTYTQAGLTRKADTSIFATGSPANVVAPEAGNPFTYTGQPYTEYTGSEFPIAQQNMLRVGYMLGFSYAYSNRWLIDALVQHSPLKPEVKGGYNLNTALSAPYFRLSVGYKLTK